jgi:hypothetical protein
MVNPTFQNDLDIKIYLKINFFIFLGYQRIELKKSSAALSPKTLVMRSIRMA